ncbi:MAG: GGDEF domain-containing protein [Streptococcus gallolyticus]|uniref:GGDEF domain-containing protein n=1 Tax=Streptococcus gallolyticus TaxID=315405 RepID=A0A927XM43_9STRE|nr:GGDEF domain-containing protein [Streptococcus gallolyticus]
MVLGKVSDFLIKHQRLLTYLSIFAALMLLMRLVYDDVLIDHDNPTILIILVGILVLCIIASYLNRRQHMLSHFILQSAKLINVYAVDLDYRFIAVNKNDIRLMEEIFYFTPKIGDFPMNYLDSEAAARLKENIDRAKKGETFTFMDTIKKDDKTLYWQNMYSPIYNNHKKVIGVFCFVLDVTEQRLHELEIQRMAYEDDLTRVHNRRYIELAFEEYLMRKEEKITVIISDLDKFKEANDTFGHATGDKILIEFGDILTKIMPKSAVIARLGGDEFAVLLPGVSENQAEFLIKLVQSEMTLKDMGVTASLGAYTGSYQSHKNFVDFCAIADKKMYKNKSQKGEGR